MMKAEVVEDDLASKSVEVLKEEHPWALVELDGRDLTLKGISPTAEANADAKELINGTYDVRTIIDQTELLAIASPYIFKAVKEGKKVTLTGNYPNQADRNKIVEAAKEAMPEAVIVDEMVAGRGAPNKYTGLTDFALSQLSGFETGSVGYSDMEYSIEGNASSLDNYETIISDIGRKLPDDVAIASQDVKSANVSPYTLSAELDGDTVRLKGFAPSQDVKLSIANTIKQQIPDVRVLNRLRIAEGAMEGFEKSVGVATGVLGKLSSGSISWLDEKLTVSGEAKSEDDFNQSNELLSGLPSGITLAENGVSFEGAVAVEPEPEQPQIPIASPYRWAVAKSDAGITLRGNVPDEETAKSTLDSAASEFVGLSFTDRQTIAAGHPDDFEGVTQFLISEVNKLDAGQGSIVDKNVLISGRVSDEETKLAIEEAAKANAPSGYTVSTNILAPKPAPEPEPEPEVEPAADATVPYRWSLSKTVNGVIVRGNAESEEDSQNIANRVSEILGITTIDNRQVVASGKPDNFDAVREILALQVSRLDSGQANIIDNTASVFGRISDADELSIIETVMQSGLPQGFNGNTNILLSRIAPEPEPTPEPKPEPEQTPAPEPEPEAEVEPEPKPEPKVESEAFVCQQNIIQAINGRQVFFDTNRATIKSESNAVLDAVAQAAISCKNITIEIAGHTDSRGRDNFNMKLSEARALSVQQYLISAGVDANQLEAKGYGETQPVADNETSDGRSKNRRIEFNVIE